MSMDDFLHPKRPNDIREVARQGKVSVRCYWPESNEKPRFEIHKDRWPGDKFDLDDLDVVIRLLNEVRDEYWDD